jgi:hypothetical protein
MEEEKEKILEDFGIVVQGKKVSNGDITDLVLEAKEDESLVMNFTE